MNETKIKMEQLYQLGYEVNEGPKIISEIKKGLALSIQTKDSHSVISWCKRIESYMKTRFGITVEDRVYLIKLLYGLLNSNIESNSLPHLLNSIHYLLRKPKELENSGLILDWRLLYNLLEERYFLPSRNKSPFDEKRLSDSIYLVLRNARRYFKEDATEEILKEFMPHLVPLDKSRGLIQSILVGFLPSNTEKVNLWIKDVFDICNWIGTNNWSLVWFDLISRVAEDRIGHFDWTPYLPQIFSTTINSLSLPNQAPPPPRSGDSAIHPALVGNSDKLVKCSKLIINMIYDSSPALDYLVKFLIAIESFCHPSNNGRWTNQIAKLILGMAEEYSNRLKKEKLDNCKTPMSHRLTPELNKKFVQLLKTPALLMIFGKDFASIIAVQTCVRHLSYISPSDILPDIIEKSYASLENLTETHRTLSLLATLSHVAPLISSRELYPEGATHILPLLRLCLPGIDTNDTMKTLSTIQVIFNLSVNICYIDATTEFTQSDLSDLDYDVRSSTSLFEEWMLSLMERVFQIMENLPDNIAKSQNGMEMGILRSLSGTFEVILSQSSISLYKMCLKKFVDFISHSSTNNIRKACELLATSFVTTNPALALESIFPLCSEKIMDELKERTNDTESVDHLDDKLLWFFSILSRSMINSGDSALKYKDQIVQILDKTTTVKSKKLYKTASKFLKNILKTLTARFPREYKSVPLKVWESKEFQSEHFLRWGKVTNKDDIGVLWHVPSPEEVNFAVYLLERYLTPQLQLLSNLKNLSSGDNVLRSMTIMRYCSRGMVCFLPPNKENSYRDSLAMEYIPLETGQCIQAGHPLHSKVVDFRKRILSTVHNVIGLYKFERDDHIACLKIAVKTIKVLLTNRGISVDKISMREKGFKYYKLMLRNPCLKSSLPRYLEVKRLQILHLSRQAQNSYFAPLDNDEMALVHDLLELSIQNGYAITRKKSQSNLETCLKCFPKVRKDLIRATFDVLMNKESKAPQIKGALYTLKLRPLLNLCVKKWKFQNQFMICMSQCHFDEENSIQELIKGVTLDYISKTYKLSLDPLKPTDEVIQLSKTINFDFDSVELKKKLDFVEKIRSENVSIYQDTVQQLYEIIKTNSHWKFQLISANFLSILLNPDMINTIQKPEIYKWFYDSLTDELPQLRNISLRNVNSLLYYAKLDYRKTQTQPHKVEIHVKDEKEFQLTIKQFDQPLKKGSPDCYYVDDTAIGWNLTPVKYWIYYPGVGKIVSNKMSLDYLEKKITDTNFWLKFVSLFSHEQNPNQKGDAPFREQIYQFIKGLAKHFEDSFVDALLPHLIKLSKDYTDTFSQKLVVEIVSGLIRASGGWDLEKVEKLSKTLQPILIDCFNNVTVESLIHWITCFKYIFSNKDLRRYQWLVDLFVNAKLDDNQQYSLTESMKLSFMIMVLEMFSWRAKKYHQIMIAECLRNISHPYKNVRELIGRLVYKAVANDWKPKDQPQPYVINFFDQLLILLQSQKEKYDTLTPEQILADTPDFVKTSKTLLMIISESSGFNKTISLEPFFSKLIPCIFQMTLNDEKDLQLMSKAALDIMVGIKFRPETVFRLLESIKVETSSHSWHIRMKSMHLLQFLVLRNLFYFDEKSIKDVVSTLTNSLSDSQFEVREKASMALSSIVMSWERSIISPLQKKFSQGLKKKAPSTREKALTQTDIEVLNGIHSMILGMSALILAFPFNVPSWMPSALETIVAHANDPTPVQTTVRKILSEFKRTHQDSWHEDKNAFSEEQLSVLSDLLISPSYYA